MKLFEKIPASFFSVLASPNREIYWLALVKLHELLEYDLQYPGRGLLCCSVGLAE